jgi:hypothetical protein
LVLRSLPVTAAARSVTCFVNFVHQFGVYLHGKNGQSVINIVYYFTQ